MTVTDRERERLDLMRRRWERAQAKVNRACRRERRAFAVLHGFAVRHGVTIRGATL